MSKLLAKNGFTLIELLVVIAIIGILASIILISLYTVRAKGRIGAGQSLDSQIYHLIAANMVGEWKFNEPSGSTAVDTSGNTTGYIVGPTRVPGLEGSALSFTAGDYVDIGCPAINTPGCTTFTLFEFSGDFTASSWIKTSVTGASTWYQWLGDEWIPLRMGWSFLVVGDNGSAAFNVDYGTCCQGVLGKTVVNDGNWHNIIGVRQGSTAYIYIDGSLQGSTALNGTPNFSQAEDMLIGRDVNNFLPYTGLIDQVRIYNSALTAQAVQKLYAEEAPRYLAANTAVQ